MNFANLSSPELVSLFERSAHAQDRALMSDDIRTVNRLFRALESIETELKSRPGDQRHLLIPLLEHANAQVRVKAALAVLAVAPVQARETLQAVADSKEYPPAAEALFMLRSLDDGSYTPT